MAVPSLAFFKLAGSLGASHRVILREIGKVRLDADYSVLPEDKSSHYMIFFQHLQKIVQF